MGTVAVNIIYGLAAASVGAACSWWICRQSLIGRFEREQGEEVRWAREVLQRLTELTMNVANSVGEHNDRLKQIADDLATADSMEPAVVAAAVAKLVAANERLEGELAAAEERLHEQAQEIEAHAVEARTDALTQVANRRAFDDELNRRFDESTRQGRPFTLMLIDIDHFKEFNDANGHQAGDAVLRGISSVIRDNTRTMDLVARYGGEEFAVVMPGTCIQDAMDAAERARNAIGRHRFRFEGRDFRITVSAGLSELRGNENTSELLRRADRALYAAKDAGRDVCWYHDGRECQPVSLKSAKAPVPEETVKPAVSEEPLESDSTSLHLSSTEAVEKKANATAAIAQDDLPDWDSPGLTFTDRPGLCQQVRSRIAEWKRGGAAFTLLYVEIDALKGLARESGKATSDLAARRLAQVIAATTREMDVVARFSPTSFAMLLPRTQLEEALSVTKRLQDDVCAFPLRTGNNELRFSVSAGLAGVIEGDDLVRLLRRTESALRSAQGQGGGATHIHNGQWAEPVSEPAGAN